MGRAAIAAVALLLAGCAVGHDVLGDLDFTENEYESTTVADERRLATNTEEETDTSDTSVLRVALISQFGADKEATFQRGLKFGAEYINNELGGIPVGESGTKLKIEITDYQSNGDKTDAGQIATCVTQIANGLDLDGNAVGNIDVIVAGTSSTNGAVINNAQTAQIPSLHTGGGNPAIWKSANTYSFGMHLPFPEYTKGPMKLFELNGMKSIGIIRSQSSYFSRYSTVAALRWAQLANLAVVGPSAQWCGNNNGITVTCEIVGGSCHCGEQSVADDLGLGITIADMSDHTFYELGDDASVCTGEVCGHSLDNTNLTDFFRGVFRDMMDQGPPDVILNFAASWHNVLQAMVEENFAPKVVVGWQGGTTEQWATTNENTGTLSNAHGYWNVGFGQWHKAYSYTDPVFGTNAKAVTEFESEAYSAFNNGGPLDYDTAGGLASAVVLYQALKKYAGADFPAKSVQERRDAVRGAIGDMNDETMWGPVRFNRNNQNSGRGTAAWQVTPDTSAWPVPVAQQLCILPSDAAEAALVIPFATWESRFSGCPKGTFNTGAVCEPCGAGFMQADVTPGFFVDGQEPERACKMCEKGKYQGDVGGSMCLDCSEGYFASTEGLSACTQCSAGRTQNESGQTSCYNCPKGTFSDLTMVECTPCEKGTYADSTGMEACFACPTGKAIDERGQSACVNCAIGKFAATLGMATCEDCEGALSTQYPGSTLPNDCQCPEGTYKDKADRDLCLGCPEGMTCAFGSDEINYASSGDVESPADAGPTTPQLQLGFFSEVSSPLSVFKCPLEDACTCPGGDPGACIGDGDKMRTGLLCFDCQEGFVRTECGCEPCSPMSKASIVVLPIIAFGACIVLYYLGNSTYSVKGSISLTFFIFAGLVVTVLWLCAIMHDMAVPWPGAQKSVFKAMSIFALNPDALGLECGLGTDPVLLYAVRCVLPLAIILAVLICHVASKVAALVNPALGWELNKSFNTIGAIFQALFILLVVIAVTPLNRYSHPNGRQSLVSSPTVMYGESGDWEAFLGLGICVFLAFVIPFFTITVWATMKAPALMMDKGFPVRFRFWLYRFRPDCWWWGVLLNVRQILLAFVSSVPADDPHSQSTYFVVVLGAYLILQTRYWPWKNHELNMAEATLLALVMFMMKAVTAFMPTSEEGHHAGMLTFFMLVVAVEIVSITAVIGYAFYRKADLGSEFSFRTGDSLQEKLAVRWAELVSKCNEIGDGETKSIIKNMNAYDVQNVLQSINAFHAAAPKTIPPVKTDNLMSDFSLTRVVSNQEVVADEARTSERPSNSAPA